MRTGKGVAEGPPIRDQVNDREANGADETDEDGGGGRPAVAREDQEESGKRRDGLKVAQPEHRWLELSDAPPS